MARSSSRNGARALLSQAATQVAALAAAQHIALPFDDVVQHVEQAVQVTGRNPVVDAAKTSNAVRPRKSTRVCGAVVRLGEELGHQHACEPDAVRAGQGTRSDLCSI